MAAIQVLTDTTEMVELYKPAGLYLKPMAKVHVSVTLPQLKDPGQSISNWDLMERLKKLVNPIIFTTIKVSKSTMEFVRFEAEVSNREVMTKVIKALDNATLKVIGFFEVLKVKAGEAKADFPSRHDWDSFFRDAKNMNEMRPGERPDTIYMGSFPVKWFRDTRPSREKESRDKDTPSEFLLRRVMGTFGEIRCVDIPVADRFRSKMDKTGMRTAGFNYGGEITFEAYVQYVEYISFVKAMDALRGMKLVYVESEDEGSKAFAAAVKVDYDRTKHLSDKNIRRRRIEREQLEEEERIQLEKEERERLVREAEEAKLTQEARERRRKREEKRKIRQLEKKRKREEQEIERKIEREERKLLVADRKLKSVRLLTELLRRAEMVVKQDEVQRQERELEETVLKKEEEKAMLLQQEIEKREKLLQKREKMLKQKVMKKYKEQSERKQEYKREEKRKRVAPEQLQSVAAVPPTHHPEPRGQRGRSPDPIYLSETRHRGPDPNYHYDSRARKRSPDGEYPMEPDPYNLPPPPGRRRRHQYDEGPSSYRSPTPPPTRRARLPDPTELSLDELVDEYEYEDEYYFEREHARGMRGRRGPSRDYPSSTSHRVRKPSPDLVRIDEPSRPFEDANGRPYSPLPIRRVSESNNSVILHYDEEESS